ncbi:MAG: hydroxymethylglutaryl-CoA lyase [Planctomycetota bacterium]
MAERVEIIECPRDAFQGIAAPIPTQRKVLHLQVLIEAGFDHIDCGSFVSPKAVPQMADTEQVLARLVIPSHVRLIGIIANRRGLDRLLACPSVREAGYPLSVAESFQQRNTGLDLGASRALVAELAAHARAAGRELVVYISMAFGNPDGDPWSPDLVAREVERVAQLGVAAIQLADTVGRAAPAEVRSVFAACRDVVPPGTQLGLHLHARPERFLEKLDGALDAGCRRFDAALGGIGGCPFAGDDLVANLPTEHLLPALESRGFLPSVSARAIVGALDSARRIAIEFGGKHR